MCTAKEENMADDDNNDTIVWSAIALISPLINIKLHFLVEAEH